MPEIKINLTPEQLVAAYTQLSRREQRDFLKSLVTQTDHPHIAMEWIAELKATLLRKFSPDQQRLLDKLLDANNERKLRPGEQKQLDELIAEYGEDLVEKARAHYLLELANRAEPSVR